MLILFLAVNEMNGYRMHDHVAAETGQLMVARSKL